MTSTKKSKYYREYYISGMSAFGDGRSAIDCPTNELTKTQASFWRLGFEAAQERRRAGAP